MLIVLLFVWCVLFDLFGSCMLILCLFFGFDSLMAICAVVVVVCGIGTWHLDVLRRCTTTRRKKSRNKKSKTD